jgi:hypothetical protein
VRDVDDDVAVKVEIILVFVVERSIDHSFGDVEGTKVRRPVQFGNSRHCWLVLGSGLTPVRLLVKLDVRNVPEIYARNI